MEASYWLHLLATWLSKVHEFDCTSVRTIPTKAGHVGATINYCNFHYFCRYTTSLQTSIRNDGPINPKLL